MKVSHFKGITMPLYYYYYYTTRLFFLESLKKFVLLCWKLCFQTAQFSSVQLLSHVFVTPWIAAHQASLSITNSRSSCKLMSIESVCHPAISSSVVPFSSCPQSLSASESFPMSHHFMANRWGNSGWLYFSGLQNHCRWWLQTWN